MRAITPLLCLAFLALAPPASAKYTPPLPDSENLIANASPADITAKIAVDDDPAASATTISAEPVTFVSNTRRWAKMIINLHAPTGKYLRQTPTDGAYFYATVAHAGREASIEIRFQMVNDDHATGQAKISESPSASPDETFPVFTVSNKSVFNEGHYSSTGFGGQLWTPPSTTTFTVYGIHIPLSVLTAEAAYYPQDKYHYLPISLDTLNAANAPYFKIYPSEAAAFLKIVNAERAKATVGK